MLEFGPAYSGHTGTNGANVRTLSSIDQQTSNPQNLVDQTSFGRIDIYFNKPNLTYSEMLNIKIDIHAQNMLDNVSSVYNDINSHQADLQVVGADLGALLQ